METKGEVLIETVRDLLEGGQVDRTLVLVENLHPADAAEVLEALDTDLQVLILSRLQADVAAKVLLEMEESTQVELAGIMKTGRLYEVLESMPADDAVDILGEMPGKRRSALLHLFRPDEAEELETLLSYPKESAGGLMTPDFFAVDSGERVGGVIDRMRKAPRDIETIYYVYVTDDDGVLLGVCSARDLILAEPNARIADIIETDVISTQLNTDREVVSELFDKYELLALPVLDRSGRLEGIVTVDDVLEVMDEEAEEDLIRFIGEVGEDEIGRGGLMRKASARLPWFVLTALVELLIVVGVLKLYTPVLEEVVALVFFIPLLVIVGGNLAVQSASLMSERLTYGMPGIRSGAATVMREVGWGVLVGAVAGGMVVGVSALIGVSLKVGLVVGVSLVATFLFAAGVGSLLPIAWKSLGKDPALVSEPVLGTLMDVVSLSFYLLVGTLVF